MREKDLLIWLSNHKEIGALSICRLFERYKTAEAILEAPFDELKTVIPEKAAGLIKETERKVITEETERYKDRLLKEGFGIITINDDLYPDNLKNIFEPPQILYFKGNIQLLKEDKKIAIVGSRQATLYGREAASYFAASFGKAGFTVVSGLAFGIDAAAHKAVLKDSGKTIGVMGSGINVIYPKGNTSIYMEMYEKGLVISENGLDIGPFSFNFPIRNRIISGMSEGVLVVEAREKSGSLITADQALEQGRNVYAVPGRINDPLSEGTNLLIKNGALISNNAETVIEDMIGISDFYDGRNKERDSEKKEKEKEEEKEKEKNHSKRKNDKKDDILVQPLDENEKKIYKIIGSSDVFIDDIISITGLSPGVCIRGVIELMRGGFIKETERGYYIRRINL